jgi:hypothetical protein
MRNGHRQGSVVLFLNDDLWDSFNQLAAALLREGIDPVRVVTGSASRDRLPRFVEWLLYRGVIDLDAPDGLDRVRQLIDAGRVLDVQSNELLLAELGLRSEIGDLVARASGVSVDQRESWVDKLWLAASLEALGVRIPEYYAATEVTLPQVAARLGFPLVVKGRIGAGGNTVRIVHDLEGLNAAVLALGGVSSALFYQRFVPGELVGYGAVRSSQGTVAEFTACEVKGQRNPLGPTAIVNTTDDAALAEVGRGVLDGLGCRRLAAIEFIADAQGMFWMIDLSTRAWGNFLSFGQVGLDLAAAYVEVLHNPDAPAACRRVAADRTLRVVPYAARDESAALSLPRLMAVLARDLRPYVRRLGLRYCAAVVPRVLKDRGWHLPGAVRRSRRSEALRRRHSAGVYEGPTG